MGWCYLAEIIGKGLARNSTAMEVPTFGKAGWGQPDGEETLGRFRDLDRQGRKNAEWDCSELNGVGKMRQKVD
jgi:hypothetical protein